MWARFGCRVDSSMSSWARNILLAAKSRSRFCCSLWSFRYRNMQRRCPTDSDFPCLFNRLSPLLQISQRAKWPGQCFDCLSWIKYIIRSDKFKAKPLHPVKRIFPWSRNGWRTLLNVSSEATWSGCFSESSDSIIYSRQKFRAFSNSSTAAPSSSSSDPVQGNKKISNQQHARMKLLTFHSMRGWNGFASCVGVVQNKRPSVIRF